MKTYEKPRLLALSLSGNDHLCGSCDGGTKLCENDDLRNTFSLLYGYSLGDKDGTIEREDFDTSYHYFGDGETQCSGVKINGYCKFTAAHVIVWS